ncbi:hypothetical protein M885DRAFT_573508 [Pelagophyceae sp. CCMP2097]|nr:hypothetical protein M885DRAFT_573508 [Pelagophyceae sp. CCMP2097]
MLDGAAVRALDDDKVLSLPFSALPRVDVEAAAVLVSSALSATDLEMDLGAADFAETLEKLAAEVESFERHIIRWGHQTARHEKMVEILTVDRRVLVVNPVIGSIRVEYFEPGKAKAIVDTGFIDLLIKAEVAAQLPVYCVY